MINCDNCGACCMNIGVPPIGEVDGDYIGDIEYERLPPELKEEIDDAWEMGPDAFAGKPCIWFNMETRRCINYDYRPDVCERFEPGNPFCLEDREAAERRAEEKNDD
jgi:uncharacterized protein